MFLLDSIVRSLNIILLMKSPSRMWLILLGCWRSWVSQDTTLSSPPPTKPLRVWAPMHWRDFRAIRRPSKVTQTQTLQQWLAFYINCRKPELYLCLMRKLYERKWSRWLTARLPDSVPMKWFTYFLFFHMFDFFQFKSRWNHNGSGTYKVLASCEQQSCVEEW